MKSVWNEGLDKPVFDTLRGDIRTEVLIIGGGMAGLLCGYMLKNRGVDCVIAEADKIGGGVTGNTTAKITCQHGAIYDTMIERFGLDIARQYFCAQQEALAQYQRLSREIACDFEMMDSYVYSVDHEEIIEKEVRALNRIGCAATFEKKVSLPFPVAGAVRVKNQAQFHPLKLAYGISKKLPIFEHTKVLKVSSHGAVTNTGQIQAKAIIVATHFPFINRYGGFFLKMYQHRSYVLALQNATPVDGMFVDEAETGLSFRKYGDLLLLGGGGHRTGKTGGNWQKLRQFAQQYYPYAREVGHWATQDCKTLDGIPYIGQYSKWTPGLYVATGFNKWGMTSSMVAAMLLADLVQEKKNGYAAVFSPSRNIMHPQLAVNVLETAKGLLTPTSPRCPHLGCALKYNTAEHSWDCACHGSRFTRDGRLLNNPATRDM